MKKPLFMTNKKTLNAPLMGENYPTSKFFSSLDMDVDNDKMLIEQFLMDTYQFRHNELSGKVEFCKYGEDFRPITEKAMNSILRSTEIALPELSGHKHHVEQFIFSEETPSFDPAKDWLESLPEWDGVDRVVPFLTRLPGLSSEQAYWMHVWMRSAVAHWLGMDTMHGNECVPTLIGPQGCGKSTFCQRMLPAHLRCYYLDHINLANKHDKEMALTNNLLVNIDEIDQVRHSQHAELKQTLSKSKVNGRPIYGRSQMDRKRFASFIATTNNPHPLTDPTGSRRYICISIPEGKLIDNETEIEYDQLYAQLLCEVRENDKRYWFTNEETFNIQRANIQFQHKLDLEDIVTACFRIPKDSEKNTAMSINDIAEIVSQQYPLVKVSHGTKVRLGKTLKDLGFEQKTNQNRRLYYVIIKGRNHHSLTTKETI